MTQKSQPTLKDMVAAVAAASNRINPFIPKAQLQAIGEQFLEDGYGSIKELYEITQAIDNTPVTYAGNGGEDAPVLLHYFSPTMDWYIFERDCEGDGTEQAYGFAASQYNGELGYININELTADATVNIDFYFTPKTLGEIQRRHSRVYGPSY